MKSSSASLYWWLLRCEGNYSLRSEFPRPTAVGPAG